MSSRTSILIAEDDCFVQELLQSMLGEDHRIVCATTIREASVVLRTTSVDLIILDSVLRGHKSDEVAALAGMLGIPVIGMSEHAREPLLRHACLKKPFAVDTMLCEVRSALEQRCVASCSAT